MPPVQTNGPIIQPNLCNSNKNNSQTFSLVYRAQNDPRIHDSSASDMVFTEKPLGNANAKIKQRGDLEEEFGLSVRPNEGEAANHGIFYDDSEYDYMQHMRDLGGSDAYFIDATPVTVKGKDGKGKRRKDLSVALRDLDLGSETRSQAGVSVASSTVSIASDFFDEDLLPSEFVKRTTYQDMQDVPDAIAGFQPDMDPRLREVLEALEDEAYVDDDEDVFQQLQQDTEEVDRDDFEDGTYELEGIQEEEEEEDEGWESDRTIKAESSSKPSPSKDLSDPSETPTDEGGGVHLPPPETEAGLDGPDHGDGAWLEEFSKFKKDQKTSKPSAAQRRLDLQSAVTGASSLASGRRKKRKGAMTSTSGYSMSSSVLARTEGQSILDRRFDKLEEEYAGGDDDDGGINDTMSMMSGMTGLSKMSGLSKVSAASSQAPQLLRTDFDGIMDDFLGKYSKVGKVGKHVRRGKPQTGLEQLDELRRALGPPRVKAKMKG
jgi:protein LTV1